MTIIDRLREIENRAIRHGAHDSFYDGLCIMEAVAYIAGEEHSDRPYCVSPTISEFLRVWNDGLGSDEERELLRPLMLSVLDTRSTPAAEGRRAWMCADWLIRVNLPAWLDLMDLDEHAARLRGLPEITALTGGTGETLQALREVTESAKAICAGTYKPWSVWKVWGVGAAEAALSAACVGSRVFRDALDGRVTRPGRLDPSWTSVIFRGALGAAMAAWATVESGVAKAAVESTVRRLQPSAQDLVERMCKVEENA